MKLSKQQEQKYREKYFNLKKKCETLETKTQDQEQGGVYKEKYFKILAKYNKLLIETKGKVCFCNFLESVKAYETEGKKKRRRKSTQGQGYH